MEGIWVGGIVRCQTGEVDRGVAKNFLGSKNPIWGVRDFNPCKTTPSHPAVRGQVSSTLWKPSWLTHWGGRPVPGRRRSKCGTIRQL